MKVQQFCDDCATAADSKVKGFDFSIFMPLVLQALVSFLSKCGDDDIVERIEKRDFWAQYAVRKSIKDTAREEGIAIGRNLKATADVILDTAQQTGESGIKSLLAETRSNVPDFDAVWN